MVLMPPNKMEKMSSDEPEAAPPAYESLNTSDQQPHRVVPPATNGKRYFEKETKSHIAFCFSPDPTKPYPTQLWSAQMIIKCDNVPQLMLEGLRWTTDSVLWEDGYVAEISAAYMHIKTFEDLCEAGLTWTRHYFLQDIQQEPPRWIAHLQVHAETCKTLAGIKLGELSIQNVVSAYAWGSRREYIYSWIKKKPWEAYNAIYDDMPMDGWWPWPKRENI
ncbi:hypothetical protein F4813DRAFT_368013 [Daldinia decipiens]|uniref:uncharacterized protein n=1 Tax=Daldinia decipiens TaxID=326647 RepID=UPI0020C30B46|nr:uncharacterized protein F4813DRAFT_368013 [Daldinia decipiens]KAI1655186.1 hypothetical protein F4813DRAFT_368013 [Daldinia decipiens]